MGLDIFLKRLPDDMSPKGECMTNARPLLKTYKPTYLQTDLFNPYLASTKNLQACSFLQTYFFSFCYSLTKL